MASPLPGQAPAANEGLIGGLQSSCERHSGMTLSLIVVLLCVIFYLLACQYGWLAGWLGETAPKAARDKKRAKKKAAPADEDDDLEDLISKVEQ